MRKSQFGQEQKGMGLQRAKSGMRVSKDFRKLAVSELRKVKQIKYDDRRPNGLVADLSLDHSILHRREVWRVYHKRVCRMDTEDWLTLKPRRPKRMSFDNETGVTSRALDHWADCDGVALDFSKPDISTDNAQVEAFPETLGQECLSRHWLGNLEEAIRMLEEYRADQKHHTHHSALGQLTTAEFWTGGDFSPGRSRAVISREYWSKIGDPSKLARKA